MPDEPATPNEETAPQDSEAKPAAEPTEPVAADATQADAELGANATADEPASAGDQAEPTAAAADEPPVDASGAPAEPPEADAAEPAAGDQTEATDEATAPVDDVEAQMLAMMEGGEQGGGDAPATPADSAPTPEGQPFVVPPLDSGEPQQDLASIELLDDVELDVKIELGRTDMYIEDVLQLGVGSVVELDKLAGDPVDIYVNERLVARGEVLVLNDNFCVRVNDIVSPVPELEGSA